jgi:hypothetical protein
LLLSIAFHLLESARQIRFQSWNASMTDVKSVVIVAALAGLTFQPPAAPQPPAIPATLALPPGFTATVFASGLTGARLMAVSPEGAAASDSQ